jgi:hypothetical protein
MVPFETDARGNVKVAMADEDLQTRIASSARLKFVDTTPGGNFAINPPPQFTRTADPKVLGRFNGGTGLMSYKGLGRYYSEAIDDNAQVIHMRFGVPQFNSLTTFFTGFYDTGAGQLARTGRASSAFYMIGRAAGFVISIMSWKILAVHLLGVGLRFAMNKPSSKFYYLKPTMPLYWNAVQTMVNQIAVNLGIVPRIGGQDQQTLNNGYQFDAAALQKLHDLLPDVFRKDGGIDVYALANRAQRLARVHELNLEKAADSDGTLTQMYQQVFGQVLQEKGADYHSYLEKWFGAANSQPTDQSDGTATEQLKLDDASNSGFMDFLKAEWNDGGAFASFRVNATGQVSESFTSSTRQSDLQNKMNNMSSQSRSTVFSLAGGNLDDGILGKTLGAITGAVKDVASGIMTQMSVQGIAALGGAAFVDIPEHWESSVASLAHSSYTIHLTSPYGNPISQLLNIHLPLAMLLAGALPLSTGKQSYTSPFLLEMYDQGRCQTRLGIIDSLQVTRGTTSLGFNNDGHVMGIDVTFTVKDLSSIIHMPINQGFSLAKAVGTVAAGAAGGAAGASVGSVGGPVGSVAGAALGAGLGAGAALGVFDEDTAFSDYMAVLSGMGLADQIYQYRKLKLNLTRQMANFESWKSPARWASFAGDTLPSRLWSVFYKGNIR